MMRIKSKEIFRQVVIICLLAVLAACDGPAEKAGQELDETIRSQREKIEETEEQIKQAKAEIEELRRELQQAKEERQRAETQLSQLRQERQKILAELQKVTGQRQGQGQQVENQPGQATRQPGQGDVNADPGQTKEPAAPAPGVPQSGQRDGATSAGGESAPDASTR